MIDVDFSFIFLVELGDHTAEHGEIGARDRRPEFKRNRSGRIFTFFVVSAAAGNAESHNPGKRHSHQTAEKFLFHNNPFPFKIIF